MKSGSQDELRLTIGGLIIRAVRESGEGVLSVPLSHERFVVQEGEPEIDLRIHFGQMPEVQSNETPFDSGSHWSLHRSNGNQVLRFWAPNVDLTPYQLAVLNSDFTRGDVYIKPLVKQPGFHLDPINYPFDEVLMVNRLSKGRGMIIHACGVARGDHGMMFIGSSGAGKSTLANLWKGRQKVNILSDDRIIVRQAKDGLRMYGTPWHGDALTSSPENAVLERVFFIKHAQNNYLSRLSASEAATRLIVCCFPTFWDPAGMQYTLELCDAVGRNVECYEFGFVPDESALDYVLA